MLTQCRINRVKTFLRGQTEPMEILGTFDVKIMYDVTGLSIEDQFMVIKSRGTTLLSKGKAEKLNVLCVRPVRAGVYLITLEGTDVAVREQFPELFSGIGKLSDFQLKLHVNCDDKPVAQRIRRIPGMQPSEANGRSNPKCGNAAKRL